MAFCAPAEMGELQAIEKMLKKPIPVLGGAAWAADIVAAAPKPGQNRGQRPGAKGGQKPGAKPPAKPHSQRPGGPRGGSAKPQGGSFAPRRVEGGKPGGAQRRPG